MRLIDADALLNELDKLDLDYGAMGGVAECMDIIENAPTIEPSGDLISREEAIEAAASTKPIVRSTERNWGKMIAEEHSKELVKALKALPSADRPKGEWILTDNDKEYIPLFYTCSVCGMKYTEEYNYCPNCGADMRGDENNGNK